MYYFEPLMDWQSGVTTTLQVAVLHESCAPVLLERRTRRLRKTTANENLRSELAHDLTPLTAIIRAVSRPTKMLIFSPMVLLFALLMGLAYGLMYLLYTSMSEVYESYYGFSIGLSGVAYLGAGIGTFIGLGIIMYFSDRIAIRKANGGPIKPEHRLPPLIYGYLPFPAGFLIYGWTAQYHAPWIAPVLGNGLTGIGVLFVYVSKTTLPHRQSIKHSNPSVTPAARPDISCRLLSYIRCLLFSGCVFLPLCARCRPSSRWEQPRQESRLGRRQHFIGSNRIGLLARWNSGVCLGRETA